MTEYRLTKMPQDVFKIIIEKQGEIKKKKGTNSYSFASTIYNIVREWHKMKEEAPKL